VAAELLLAAQEAQEAVEAALFWALAMQRLELQILVVVAGGRERATAATAAQA